MKKPKIESVTLDELRTQWMQDPEFRENWHKQAAEDAAIEAAKPETTKRYEKAVGIITRVFEQDGFFHQGATGERGQRGDVAAGDIAGRMMEKVTKPLTWRDAIQYSGKRQFVATELDAAISAAKAGRYLADRALRLAFKASVKNGYELPAALLEYIAAVIVDDPELKLASRGGDTLARDKLICWAIQRAVDSAELSASRNDDTVLHQSACDAVAEVLATIDREAALEFAAVKAIWLRRNRADARPSVLWQS
jgi:hypothetical protein